MTEDNNDTTPPPGSFDYLVQRSIEIPVPPSQASLRVDITARARVYPSRGWAVAIVIWALLVLLLLARAGHAQELNQHSMTWADVNDRFINRPWGTTHYFWLENNGGLIRCATWQWRGETRVRCGD